MTAGLRCGAGGVLPGLGGKPPGEHDRCPLCTAQPRVKVDGTVKEHDRKSPRTR